MVAGQAWSEVAQARTPLCRHHGEPHDAAAMLLEGKAGIMVNKHMTNHLQVLCNLQTDHIPALMHCGKRHDSAKYVK